MARPQGPRSPVVDAEGRPFGEVDFGAADHLEVLVAGKVPVRVAREHFARRGEGAEVRLSVGGDELFLGKRVTTIDGIDLGAVTAVVREGSGGIEALLVGGGSEEGVAAVPLSFVREVSAHIILEPSAEEVAAAQAGAARDPAVAKALTRARMRR
jgi:hypothetical protein